MIPHLSFCSDNPRYKVTLPEVNDSSELITGEVSPDGNLNDMVRDYGSGSNAEDK
jgi:hypothetical protein